MRQLLFVALCCGLFGSAAMAQSKLETKWHCDKPSATQKLDVGDVPDHSYVIAQGSCTATAGDSLSDKSGAYTEFQEVWKAKFTNHGRFNVTTDNGDMAYYTYEGSGPTDITKPAMNKWKINNGTGKVKGINGSGGCTGARHDDGTSDWTCSGMYSMGKEGMGKEEMKK
jgi:hypothetical protein